MGASPLRGILSGGQTGVDRAVLDVALARGLPCGGWCPAGRWAEDGPLPQRYPLRETPSPEPAQRTAWNVHDADATLILARAPTGGTALALQIAERLGRPHLVVAPEQGAVGRARAWLASFGEPVLLNVAGPRASEEPGSYASARRFTEALLGRSAGRAADGLATTRVLVTGGAGLLGGALIRLAPPRWEVHATWRRRRARASSVHRVDLAERDAVRRLIERVRPDLVMHTAYASGSGERDIWEVTRNLADESLRAGAALVHISSDMVFDGERAPYAVDDRPDPIFEYGEWKAKAEAYVDRLAGESAVVRASLLVSFDPPDPRTAWVLRGLRGEERVHLFVDEIRTPILVEDMARQLWEIAALPVERRGGIWHLAGPEAFSRFALGALIAARYGLSPAPLRSALSARGAARRPRDLRLLTERADRQLLTRARPLSVAAAPPGRRR